MESFKRRIKSSHTEEFSEACHQVERIAEIRLQEKFNT
jgi:2-oxo-4-hydroxy-4-carboxy--5-ureidoimidazoline (OHCU) decarboxylase